MFRITALVLFLFLSRSAFLFSSDHFVVAAYYTGWAHFRKSTPEHPKFSLDKIDLSLLTDLYYAFAGFGAIPPDFDSKGARLTGDFRIHPFYSEDEKQYRELLDLKKRSGNKLRLFLSIGGAGFNNPKDPLGLGALTYRLFSQMVSTRENRAQFISSAIDYAHRHGFDGIEIDWEFPGSKHLGGNERDFIHFPVFLKECSEAFHAANPPILLSIAVPGTIPWDIAEENYYAWLSSCILWADRVTLMAYNYHTPFDPGKITGANAPLMRDTNPKSASCVSCTLGKFSKNNIDLRKVLLGIPLYGWAYEGVEDLSSTSNGPGKRFTKTAGFGPVTKDQSSLALFEINQMIAEKKLVSAVDPITETACAYSLENRLWISYDNQETARAKTDLARQKDLLGVIFWALDLDEYPAFPTVRAVNSMNGPVPAIELPSTRVE